MDGRRRLILATVILLAGIATALVGVVLLTAGGEGDGRDQVSGAGHVSSQDADVRVDATTEASGRATGDYAVMVRSSPSLDFSGGVTCLVVTDNTALLGGRVDRSETPSVPPASGVFIEVQDNAQLGREADKVQLLPLSAPPADCANPPAHGAGTPITSGDYVVRGGNRSK